MGRMMNQSVLAALLGCAAAVSGAFGASAAAGQALPGNAAVDSRVPLYFEENQGQTAGEVHFLARAGGYTAFLTGHETVLHYRNDVRGEGSTRDAVVRMTLSGSRGASAIQGDEKLPGIVNCLIGNDPSKWRTRIPTYGEVRYQGVYPGVDLVYRAAGKQLEFDFHVSPGSDPNPIRMTYLGASSMRLDAAGDLVLDTGAGPASILKPLAYQDVNNKRVEVAANFALLANGEVGFQLGKYDRSRPLVIDPAVGPSVYYSTYLGSGTGNDTFTSIAVDAAGEAFIAGQTYATNYPIGAESGYSPYEHTFPGNYAANFVPAGFITALNASGTGIIYSTYISGDGASSTIGAALNGIAVDDNGYAFVGGQTDDSTFPMVKAFQSTFPASRTSYMDAVGIVFELSPHGDSLVYSSFLGGGDYDSISGIAVDSSDNAYVVGTNTVQGSSNTTSGFPVTSGVIWGHFSQPNIGAGFIDAFASKIGPPTSGNATLAYSTVIGSGGSSTPFTYGKAIAVDSSGNSYVTGTANCNIGDHGGTITTRYNMPHATPASSEYVNNVWVLELNPTASAAVYLDYLGGSTPGGTFSPDTSVAGIQVDSSGVTYVTGTTEATNFQTTSNAYQPTARLAGITNSTTGTEQSDGYITLIAAGGGSVTYSTYLNGTTVSPSLLAAGYDGSLSVGGIALGTGGQFAVSGIAATTDFPVSSAAGGTPLLTSYPGCPSNCAAGAAFITKFSSTGSLLYSTFFGRGDEYQVNGVASNGTDVYSMVTENYNGLTTGGAYDTDNSSGLKEMVVRVMDPQALSTTLTVDGVTSSVSASPQSISLTSSLTASSTVDGGTVTYTVTNSSSVQVGSAVTSGIVAGDVAPATAFTLPGGTPTGTYTIHASYLGAQGFLSSSGTGSLVIGAAKASTTTAVVSSRNPALFGQAVTFTATVSSGSGTPTGTVTFTDGGSDIGTGTMSGGIATFTTSALAAGNHTIAALYSGDTNFNSSTGSLTGNPQVVNKANTTTAVTSSQNSSVFGQSVTFTATVAPVAPGTGTATGSVTFLDSGSPIGTGTISSGVATFTTSALAVGNHTITTTYGGDGNFNGSTGSLTGNPQVVNKSNTTATVTDPQNPSTSGQSVTFTATVSPVAPGAGTPTGTITFLDGGSPIGTATLSGGVATFTTSALAVGSHTVTTSYAGDANFASSTGSLTGNPEVVTKGNTTAVVTSSVNASVFGQSVVLTATVSPVAPGGGTPTGTVTFLDGGSPIGTGTLSGGTASFISSSLAVGNHTITTSYGGDSNFNANTGSLTGNPQVVNKPNTVTAVTSSQNPSTSGQSVTFTATVSPVAPGAGTPTGTITFVDGGGPIATATVSGGVATFTTSALVAGSHTLTTSYAGDANFSGSTGSLTGNPQVVNKSNTTATATSSQNPSVFGQSITFTATLSAVAPGTGTPTGTVTFLDGGSPIGTGTLTGAQATFTTSALGSGSHTITASYGGSASFNSSPGTLASNPQVVNKSSATTTVSSSLGSSVFGQSVTFTATVAPVAPGAGAATGTVTFLDGSTPMGNGTLIGGQATFTTSALAVGNHTITSSYSGDPNFIGSSGSAAETITLAAPVFSNLSGSQTISFGQTSTIGVSGTLSAGTPPVVPSGGTVTVTIGAASGVATVASNGDFSTSINIAGLSASLTAYPITYSYNATANFSAAVDASTSLTITKAAQAALTVIGVPTTQQNYGSTFTVSSSGGTGTGAVTFVASGSCSNSGMTITITSGTGSCSVTATKSADVDYTTISSPSYTVASAKANVASAGLHTSAAALLLKNSVTLTAKVGSGLSTPTGTVSFLDGSAVLGTVPLNNSGTATLTISTLAVGTNSIIAVYSGDSNFNGFTSAALTETVQDFQMAAVQGSATVLPGATASYQFQLALTNGTTFPSAVSLGLTGLPAGATYTITPASITAGMGAQTITVRVNTAKTLAELRTRAALTPMLGLFLLPMLGVVRLRRGAMRRTFRRRWLLGPLFAITVLGMTACGGGTGFLNQAPETYNLQLNATSGALQHSATVSLTVQ